MADATSRAVPNEAEVRSILSSLGRQCCKTAIDREAFDWAEDVALWFFLDEAADEWEAGSQTVEQFIASDLAYRLGTQLQEMSKDADPHEAKEARALSRAGARLADCLNKIAEA